MKMGTDRDKRQKHTQHTVGERECVEETPEIEASFADQRWQRELILTNDIGMNNFTISIYYKIIVGRSSLFFKWDIILFNYY